MDTIANLLTSIRNAELAGRDQLVVPFSNVSLAILAILVKNGFVAEFSEQEDGIKKSISISLPTPLVRHHYKRISKPGRRLYTAAQQIPTVLRGIGFVIISTPEGIMTGKEAKKKNLGGELICEVY